jgi:hypothetical protein
MDRPTDWQRAGEFASLIGAAQAEGMEPEQFDPRGESAAALAAVEAAAAGGRVRVFRVETGSARVEYFVLGLDREGARLVGLRATAVES